MAPEEIIAQFLVEAFTDDALITLRADAVAGKVPYFDCEQCFVAHTGRPSMGIYDSPERAAADRAYCQLAEWWPSSGICDDRRRMDRLIPLIDAEISRRADMRCEVMSKAREAILVRRDDVELAVGALTRRPRNVDRQ